MKPYSRRNATTRENAGSKCGLLVGQIPVPLVCDYFTTSAFTVTVTVASLNWPVDVFALTTIEKVPASVGVPSR